MRGKCQNGECRGTEPRTERFGTAGSVAHLKAIERFRRSLGSGQRGAGAGFYPSTSVSPVSTIPPLLHIHPSIYQPSYKMFFSHYFSLPCQYHSTIAPYPSINLPPTLHNVFLPVLQIPLSVSFHHCSIPIHPSTTHSV